MCYEATRNDREAALELEPMLSGSYRRESQPTTGISMTHRADNTTPEAVEFSYPPDWWRRPGRGMRKAMARQYIKNHKGFPSMSAERAASLRIEIIKLILAGLLEYDPETKRTRITQLGIMQAALWRQS